MISRPTARAKTVLGPAPLALAAASLAFVVTGCADRASYSTHDAGFDDPTCRAVATDRAIDAAVTDDDIQSQVFKLTYATCIDWHRSR